MRAEDSDKRIVRISDSTTTLSVEHAESEKLLGQVFWIFMESDYNERRTCDSLICSRPQLEQLVRALAIELEILDRDDIPS